MQAPILSKFQQWLFVLIDEEMSMLKNLCVTAICTLSMLGSSLPVSAENQNWYMQDIWKNNERAYQWYPDPNRPKQSAPAQRPEDQKPNELVQFDLLQKRLEESRKVAIMNPTEANLKTYIQLQELAMNQAATFTDQWQRVIWQNPDLDYSQRGRPINQVAQQTWDANRSQDKANAIREIAKENGILFFYRSDCPYCHAMAPILKEFSMTYGVNVMPVTLDGGTISPFQNSLPDNGIATRLGVKTVPAIFVMETRSKQFKPLAYGVISSSSLEDRFLAFSKPVGTMY